MNAVCLIRYTAFCALLCMNSSALEIIAHRGASSDAPENTVSSTKLAWAQDADASECDVWLTKDGKIIVCHDDNTGRTAGSERKLRDQTLDELRKLDAGIWKGGQWKGEKLPVLGELIETIPPGRRLFIEIKCGPEIVPELEREWKASGRKPEQLAIISFNSNAVREAKKILPGIPAFYLASYKKDKTGKFDDVETLIAKAKAAGCDGLNLDRKFPIDVDFVERVHKAGLELYIWTVNDVDMARRLMKAGVNGITTDRPQWLREQLGTPTDRQGSP